MHTELDELICKMEKLFLENVYTQETYDGGVRIHYDIFFEEVKILLKDKIKLGVN